MERKRSARAVLADFQAFQRFEEMNSKPDPTAWSRLRENDLKSRLTDELGEVFAQLRFLSLILMPQQARESSGLAKITDALKKRVNRDRPSTRPSDGLDFN